MVPHLYIPPAPVTNAQGQPVPVDDNEHFSDFYADMIDELKKHGELDDVLTLCVTPSHYMLDWCCN